MTQQSWKARKMVPGSDSLATMAMHYGITPEAIVRIIMDSGVEVIRFDKFRSPLGKVDSWETSDGVRRSRKAKVIGWADGRAGVDPVTTKLTKAAIKAVARWSFDQSEKDGDS